MIKVKLSDNEISVDVSQRYTIDIVSTYLIFSR